jgi:predicted GTPase
MAKIKKNTPIPVLRRTSGIAGVSEISASHTIGGAKITKPLNKNDKDYETKVSRSRVPVSVEAHVKKKIPVVRTRNKKPAPTKVYDDDLKPTLKAIKKKTGYSYSVQYRMFLNNSTKLINRLLKNKVCV